LGEGVGRAIAAKARKFILRNEVSQAGIVLTLCWLGTSSALALVEKPLIPPITSAPVKGTKVDVNADKITYDPKTQIAIATGKVVMVYGPYRLEATRVSYNQLTGEFKANGSVELREPNGNVLLAQKLDLRNKFKTGFAEHVMALLTNDVTITAEIARRVDGDITVFEHATYTACKNCGTKNGEPIWQIVTDETTHDNASHNLYHLNPRLKIDGTTIVSLPYWEQPDPTVKRRSGWLSPTLKFGSTYGVGIAAPYFWALAPNYDLTFTPFISSYQGLAGDIEWRHRLASGQYNVQAFGAFQANPLTAPDDQRWRGAVKSKGDFVINQDWNWGWQGTFASDNTFLRHYDYDTSLIAENNVHATGLWDQTYVSAQLLNFGSLDTSVYQNYLPTALPYVMGEQIIPDIALGGDLKLEWSAYSIRRNSANTPFTDVNHGTEQTRATSSVEWKTQLISEGGFVASPFAKVRTDLYIDNRLPDPTVLSRYRDTETTTRVLPAAGVDMRYPLIASYESGQSIISPVFQIVSASDETETNKIGNEDAVTLNLDSTSMFLSDRFTGLDRFEGGTRANLGVTYSFLGNNGNYVSASLGQTLHLAGKNSFSTGSGLNDSRSDLVGGLVVQPWENLTLSYEARVADDLSKVNRQEASASLNFDSFSTNISYLNFGAEPLYGRNKAEHWVSGDVKFNVKDGWYLFGGMSYDFYNSYLTRKTVGVEFDCDCMNFKLAYTGSQDPTTLVDSNTIMASVAFATLGGTSAAVKF
jgi:LPS-assembly protein